MKVMIYYELVDLLYKVTYNMVSKNIVEGGELGGSDKR